MPRIFDPRRRCLEVANWPPADRLLWERITGPVDLLDENYSNASRWRSATRHKNRRGYGRWLCFLVNGGCDLTQAPADRVTHQRVNAYLAELEGQRLKPYTVRNRIGERLGVMLAFAPDRDWGWLKRRLNHLDALAKEAYEPDPPPLFANEIVATCRRRLEALEHRPEAIDRDLAVEYRNILMILFLTLVPLRLRNLTALADRHFRKANAEWVVDIPGAETKTGARLVAPIPEMLLHHLAYYRAYVRPVLLVNCSTAGCGSPGSAGQ
jgi:hypothetical protein